MTARISAIIPVRNGERFVAESIRSALNQTRPVCEVVVVDDGSTDGTIDVLRMFGSDIRVVRQAPAGVAAARNAGMREASGDHFAFLDADDVWLPRKLECQMDELACAGGQGALYSGYVIADETLRPRRVVLHGTPERSLLGALALESPGLGFSFTGLATRAAVERAGPYNERLSTSADLDFVWRLSHSAPLIGVREPLALHRHHSGGQMHLDLSRVERDMERVLDEVEADGLPADVVRRARANLDTYLGFRLVLNGALAPGLARLRTAVARDPRRLVALPALAAGRRLSEHLLRIRTDLPDAAQFRADALTFPFEETRAESTHLPSAL